MNNILEITKKVVLALTPAIVGVGAAFGWDGAAIASATETFLLAVIQYVQFWISYKNK